MEFISAPCPNCKVKIKIDKDKKYQDCPECKSEFRTADMILPENTAKAAEVSLLDKLKFNSQKWYTIV